MITVDFKHLEIQPGFRILDIGCGSGRHLGEAVHRRDVFVVGADAGVLNLQNARRRLAFHEACGLCEGRWALSRGDVCHLPFSSGTFQVVICSEVLEHIRPVRLAVAELLRVTQMRGRLAVSVPRYLPEKICWQVSAAYAAQPGGHCRIFRRRQLFDLMADHGGRLLHFHFAHSLHTPFWWLKCLLDDQAALVRGYHRFLVWTIMQKPRRWVRLEKVLNPWLGKSLVAYFEKTDD